MNYRELAKQLLAEELLLEDRIDFLKEKNPNIDSSHDTLAVHKNANDIIDHFATHADPTKNKIHTQWILGQYKQKNIRQEDAPRIHSALTTFEKYKSKLDKKDINQYKSLGEVEDSISPFVGTHASKRAEDKEIKTAGADLIHKDPDSGMTVHHIKTEEAAKLYGKGTKWCTAADNNNMFGHYNKEGKLFVVQHKGEKYQYHRESGQFMNDKDEEIKSTEFNKIKDPLHKTWDKHPEIAPPKNSKMDWKYGNKSEADISNALDDSRPDVRHVAIRHPNATEEHISKALEDSNEYVRKQAIRHPNATTEHISKALNDSDSIVRIQAIQHPNATPENISKALNDSNGHVRRIAIEHPKATEEHISKALNDSESDVRMQAIQHPNATPENISKALNDSNYRVRWHAIQHPNAINLKESLEDKKFKVTYDFYGSNKEIPLYTKSHNVYAKDEVGAITTIKSLVGGTNHKAELLQEDTTLRYHKELNPKIWNADGNLQSNIEAHLVNIANDWVEFAKIPKDSIKDIVLTGGNCNYNYTSQSDLDVHIMLEYSKVSINKEILRDYYMSKKALWATRHANVNVSGYPVELFAQDISEKPHKGQGVYSLTNNEWIQKPDFLDLDLQNDSGVEFSAKEFATRINSTINNNRGIETAQPLIDEIYNMRGAGIAADGEFSRGTLIFKELRNLGLVDKLNKYILKEQDRGYSYAE